MQKRLKLLTSCKNKPTKIKLSDSNVPLMKASASSRALQSFINRLAWFKLQEGTVGDGVPWLMLLVLDWCKYTFQFHFTDLLNRGQPIR